MGKKISKNLQRVQDMVDGTYGGKIQSGYIGETNVERKVGDIWTDDDGLKWEQKKGYKIKLTKTANVGIFKAHCKDCNKGIVKPWDKDTQKADGRCYHCQMNYELDLKFDKWIRWYAYRRLHELKNMDSIEQDMIQWVDELDKNRTKNPFDETVANAMSNHNVSMEIKKNS
tara:strand:- start:58 stop:570 length:513 start_codon:yes stop_codon:yes gene_type:complete